MSLYSSFFYHQLTRKYVVAFGDLFNNIFVVRYDKNGVEAERERVPLTYAPKEKFFYRTEQDPNLDKQVLAKVPRIGFQLTEYSKAPERRTFGQRKIRMGASQLDPTKRNYAYNAEPYNLGFTLFVSAKSIDEMQQIMEQIVPFFKPTYNTTINIIPELGITLDVPVTLMTNTEDIDYDGDFSKIREVTAEFQFNVKAFYFGPVKTSSIIRKVTVNLNQTTDVPDETKYAQIEVTPYSDTIPVDQITKDDDYGYLTEITEYDYSGRSNTDPSI